MTYKIKINLRDGSCYEYESEYGWAFNEDKLNDPRNQFCEFDGGKFIVARDAILKVEKKEIETDDEKGANNEA